ncbi:MAG: DUF3592 domain-containing protein [Thermomicrobiales bacterium]
MTPGLLLAFGFALFVVWRGVQMLTQTSDDRRQARAASRWPETTGRITRTWVTTEKTRTYEANSDLPATRYVHTPHLFYEYSVGDRTYHGERVDFAPPRVFSASNAEDTSAAERYLAAYPYGASVTVYYDPDAPRQACLNPRTESDRGATRLLIGVLMMMGGVGLGALTLLSAR